MYAAKLNDPAKLAGLGLATEFLLSTALYVVIGMTGACETLVAQAFGAKKLALCGNYLNRAWLINTLLLIPIFLLLIFTKPLLGLLGQDAAVIEHANTFILAAMPSVYFWSQNDLLKRFLSCLNTTWVPMIAQVVASCLHILWCELFVVKWGWDLVGLGLAESLTSFLLLGTTMAYAYFQPEIR